MTTIKVRRENNDVNGDGKEGGGVNSRGISILKVIP
jgi:hypothetical protein